MKARTTPIQYIHAAKRLVSGLIRSTYQSSRFEIKRGYIHRSTVELFDDRGQTDSYQKEVYEKAASLMEQNGWQSVIDIGCGSGYKLVHCLGQYDIIGVDLEPVISQAQANFPNHTWLHSETFYPAQYETDLILCADVIEHVQSPDWFLQWSLSFSQWKCLMISTPERDSKRGKYHFGPPPNPHHFREWSYDEFHKFISRHYPVTSQEITNTKQASQLIICMNQE